MPPTRAGSPGTCAATPAHSSECPAGSRLGRFGTVILRRLLCLVFKLPREIRNRICGRIIDRAQVGGMFACTRGSDHELSNLLAAVPTLGSFVGHEAVPAGVAVNQGRPLWLSE